ncbi:MAG: NADPH:quinone oxidoreductase family protein [Woeseiaceae bacterium]|nr:NADPH:quinone oxidoreductase family protein [Woeseiaceae bacterium]
MRALVCNEYGPPESLVIEEWDDPSPADGEIVVDVAAAGINFPDVLSIAGKYQVRTPPPFVAGNEASGTVAAVGAGVQRFSVGDRVMIMTRGGAFASKCVAHEMMAYPLPPSLDFERGAGFVVTYSTSLHALKQCANIRAGETVLVLGAAGGVGIAAVEIAKAMGARVIAAASNAEKLAFASAAGADELIDYSRAVLRESIREITRDNGVDIVVDPVGGELAVEAYRALAWHGRHLVIGFAGGDIPQFAGNIALLKEARVVGVWWGTWAMKNPPLQFENLNALVEMLDAGMLTPRVTESHDFEDYAAAFKAITGRRALGKVVLRL